MNSRWGQILAVFAAVAVVVTGVVIVVMVTGSQPGAGPRPTATTSMTTTRTSPRPRPTLTVDSGCRIGRGPQRLVDVPQTVTDRVNRAWERIEKWLAVKAPATAATLAPPAGVEDISAMQQQIGVPIPAELIASLRRHDGAGRTMRNAFVLPPFYVPSSVYVITSEAKVMCEVLASSSDDSVGYWWHGQVIPIAFDGGGGNLLLDQRPGRGGRLGEHDEETDMMFTTYPPTLTELLEQTATSLETGKVALKHYRPKVVDGVLDWDLK